MDEQVEIIFYFDSSVLHKRELESLNQLDKLFLDWL